MSLAHINSRLSINTISSINKDCIFFLGPHDDSFVDYFGSTPVSKCGTFVRMNELGNGVLINKPTTNLAVDPFYKTSSRYTNATFTNMQYSNNKYNPISKTNGAMYFYKQPGTPCMAYRTSVSISKNTKYAISAIVKLIKGDINSINIGGTIWFTDNSYIDYTWTSNHTKRYKYICEEENVYYLTAIIEDITTDKTINYYQQRMSYNNNDECEFYLYATQIEAGSESTWFVEESSSNSVLKYNLPNGFNSSQGTISFFTTCMYDCSTKTSQQISPKYIQIGDYYSNNSITVWNIVDHLKVYTKGISSSGWTLNIGNPFVPEYKKTYHIAVTWNNLSVKLYLDEKLFASGTMTEPIGDIAGNFIIIGGDGDGTNSKGNKAQSILSSIALYSRELSEFEIQQITNNKSFYSNMIKAGVAT